MQSLFFVFLPESLRGIGGWGRRKILFKFPLFLELSFSPHKSREGNGSVGGNSFFCRMVVVIHAFLMAKLLLLLSSRDLGFWSFVGAFFLPFFCLPLFFFFFGETAVSGGFERVLLNRLVDSVVVVVVFARIHTHTHSRCRLKKIRAHTRLRISHTMPTSSIPTIFFESCQLTTFPAFSLFFLFAFSSP